MDHDALAFLARSGMVGLPSAAQSAGGVSAVHRVYESLRQKIINLDLPPNTVLTRTELALQYDVSQTPLREALQKLEGDGLVEIVPQSRTTVSRLVTSEIREAHFLRVAIETEVMRRLGKDCDPTVIKRLETILTMQEALAGNPEELPTFQELDEAFHQTLLAGAGQPGLHNLLRARSGHLNRLRRLHLPGPGKIANILKGHHEIIAALTAHDPEAGQQAIRDHLSQTISRVDDLRREYPDYFA
ncbi:GntR family transcriptional regulator [Frigidibacter sp. ROC022]|uniref:GntR family transcriptional regulator n=1 Tax=Frigidibacter sp. ROC022 TaxID=2971796 RepID=UPI00215B0171|nr:GntR family transcriptional regulator [Frigidibacter sp. ROC022]MCR8725657.1 GntR family transcriptional regulator [Frigidibacter sp. ROC022]